MCSWNQNSAVGFQSKYTSLLVLTLNSWYDSNRTLLASLIYNTSRLAPLNLLSSSALKNSIVEPFVKVYVLVVLCHCERLHRLVATIILRKSFITPLRKCGTDSATTETSKKGVFNALSINIGSIPNVFPDYRLVLSLLSKRTNRACSALTPFYTLL